MDFISSIKGMDKFNFIKFSCLIAKVQGISIKLPSFGP
jgi:hypothetical protein